MHHTDVTNNERTRSPWQPCTVVSSTMIQRWKPSKELERTCCSCCLRGNSGNRRKRMTLRWMPILRMLLLVLLCYHVVCLLWHSRDTPHPVAVMLHHGVSEYVGSGSMDHPILEEETTIAISTCKEDPVGTNYNVTRRVPDIRNFRLSLTGPGMASSDSSSGTTGSTVHNDNVAAHSTKSTTAVCELQVTEHTHHFPHAMQQLYQCWSFWNLPHNVPKTHILLIPSHAKGFPGSRITRITFTLRDRIRNIFRHTRQLSIYLDGFVDVLREAANVSVIRVHRNNHNNDGDMSTQQQLQPVWRNNHDHTFIMHSIHDARSLRDTIIQHYGFNVTPSRILHDACLNSNSSSNSNSSTSGSPGTSSTVQPRIAIVRRARTRLLLNEDSILTMLRYELQMDHVRVIHSLDGATLVQQVEAFANTDLLIASHGAELTNIPYLPKCGRVLEIFPAHYYYNMYFGSLADVSGIASYPLYLSAGDPVTEWATTQHTLKTPKQRNQIRNVDLCPPLSVVHDTVRRMIDDWYHCICSTDSNDDAI